MEAQVRWSACSCISQLLRGAVGAGSQESAVVTLHLSPSQLHDHSERSLRNPCRVGALQPRLGDVSPWLHLKGTLESFAEAGPTVTRVTKRGHFPCTYFLVGSHHSGRTILPSARENWTLWTFPNKGKNKGVGHQKYPKALSALFLAFLWVSLHGSHVWEEKARWRGAGTESQARSLNETLLGAWNH